MLEKKDIDVLLKKRDMARYKKDYKTADAIRSFLREAGFEIKDRRQITSWRTKDFFCPSRISGFIVAKSFFTQQEINRSDHKEIT